MGPRFGSPRKQTLRQNLVFGSFYERVSVRSTPVEGRGKSRSGQRESLSWSGGLAMTANPIGDLGVKWLFRIILSWARWPGFYLPLIGHEQPLERDVTLGKVAP